MDFGAQNLQKKHKCQYCGNNPVPHFLYWYFESSNVFLAPLRRVLLYNPFSRFFKTVSQKLGLSWRLVRFGRALGILKLRDDINLCGVQRAKVLWEEARKRGIKMSELLLFNRPFDVYIAEKFQIPNPKSKIVFSGLPRPTNYNDSALDWMDDKQLFKRKLIENGLPAPKGKAVWNFRQAKKIFREINKPAIVKPRAGSRGRHSTIFVSSESDLKQAFKIAKQLCFWVVVEEQLTGPVYRATVVNFELCGILRGDPPQVAGDGVHTIEQLVEIKNQTPHEGVKDIIIDPAVEMFLLRQDLNLSSILNKDEAVNLSEKVGVSYGGSSSEDFDICHPDNKDLFVRAAKVVGDPIVGFDFIIPDITKSWKDQKCGFIEANSLPFINLHHYPLHGQPRNIAAAVWNMLNL